MSRRGNYHKAPPPDPPNEYLNTSAHAPNNQRWSKASRDDDRNYGHPSRDSYNTRERDRHYGRPDHDSQVPPPPPADNATTYGGFGSRAEQILKKQQEEEERKRQELERKKDLELEALMTEDERIAKVLGFSSFGSTKGKYVKGANPFLVDFIKQKRFSQYKNRKRGGQIIPAKKI